MYVSRSLHPGNYYSYRQTLSLQRVSCEDFRVLAELPIRDVYYNADPSTLVWTAREVELPPFDLGAYLREFGVRLAFAESQEPELRVGAEGAFLEANGLREIVLTSDELARQIPELGRSPRVVGCQEARSGWRRSGPP